MPEESQALVRFEPGWVEDGVSEDGLPRYREMVRIIKSVPPYTQVEYVATEADFDENPGPYQAFQREQGARLLKPADDGFPLALWPVISPAQFKALAARDVSTIQQLAKLSGRADLPGEFKELAQRAKHMIQLSDRIGKFEALLRDRDAQIEVLVEQNKELASTITAQASMIATLKQQPSLQQVA